MLPPRRASRFRFAALAMGLFAGTLATPALAQPGWGGPGWGTPGWGDMGWSGSRGPRAGDSREGRVSAESFVGEGALPLLGQGRISVVSAPGSDADAREEATFEAAIIDQLARAGYDTLNPDPKGGQVVEIAITHAELEPEEQKRSPVSGSMTMGASNYGSGVGLAIGIDLTKPRKALIGTHIEIRVRDRVTGKALYEARADIATREDDSHWSQQAVATHLSAALFEKFPRPTARPLAAR